MEPIDAVVARFWDTLVAGGKVYVLASQVADPSSRPDLFQPVAGWPVGQGCDWAWSLPDGSRVHAQCFGWNLRLHRDRYDPNQGVVRAVQHALLETPLGIALTLVLGAWWYRRAA